MPPDTPFARRALTLLGGTTSGQLLALALAPILTRLYDPRAFGEMGLFVAVQTLVASVACLGLEQAVVLEADPAASRHAARLATRLALGASLLAAVPCASGLLPGLDRASALLLPPAIAVAALGGVAVARALALDRPRAVAAGRFLRAAATGIAQLALTLALPHDGTTLAIGIVLGQGAGLAVTAALLGRTPRSSHTDPPSLRAFLIRHRTLVAYATPQTLLNAAGNSLVPIALARIAGTAAVGDYALAARVTVLPAITLGEAMRQSLLATMAAHAADRAALRRIALRATLLLAAPLTAAAIAAIWLAPPIFALAFGARWRTAGLEAAILLAVQAAGIANIPALTAITVRRWQRAHLAFQAGTIPLRLAALLAAGLEAGPLAALAAYGTLSIAASAALTAATLRALRADPPHAPPIAEALPA